MQTLNYMLLFLSHSDPYAFLNTWKKKTKRINNNYCYSCRCRRSWFYLLYSINPIPNNRQQAISTWSTITNCYTWCCWPNKYREMWINFAWHVTIYHFAVGMNVSFLLQWITHTSFFLASMLAQNFNCRKYACASKRLHEGSWCVIHCVLLFCFVLFGGAAKADDEQE